MKKKIIRIFAGLLSGAILLGITSCSQTDDTSITEYGSTVPIDAAFDVSDLPNNEYFNTSDIIIGEKPEGPLYTFNVGLKTDLSQKEIIDKFKSTVREAVGENFDEKQIELGVIYDAETGEEVGDPFKNKLYQYESEIIDSKYTFVTVSYLQGQVGSETENLPYYLFCCTSLGDMINWAGHGARDIYIEKTDAENTPGMLAVSSFPVIKQYYKSELTQEVLDAEISLSDGKFSLGEIIEKTEKFIKDNVVLSKNDFDLSVSTVTIADLQNGNQGLEFSITPYYEGIPLCDYKNAFNVSSDSQDPYLRDKEIYYHMATATLISAEEPDAMIVPPVGCITSDKKEVKEIVSLKTALELVSEEAASRLILDVYSVRLKYVKLCDENATDDEKRYECIPVWEIVCPCKNSSDDDVLVYLVDAQTGELSLVVYSNLNYFKE